MKTDLSSYNSKFYKPGPFIKRMLWHYTNIIFFNSGLFPFYRLKIFLLKVFGAKTGRNVLIKPFVNIKYPWFLTLGNNVWIGENVWIDSLVEIAIGDNVCLSQGSMLLTGNHDYTMPQFNLSLKKIIIEEGVWIGARAVVCPGVICKSHSVLMVGAIATQSLDEYAVYGGNPAEKVRDRIIKSKSV
jgi:putative colanic acid biosynthesis acetyltransferase WcaF